MVKNCHECLCRDVCAVEFGSGECNIVRARIFVLQDNKPLPAACQTTLVGCDDGLCGDCDKNKWPTCVAAGLRGEYECS